METAYICDATRTPFGRYGGLLAAIRTDNLAGIPIRALITRNPGVEWSMVDDVVYGCANQAGEDNRNVARMALLLAGLSKEVPGTTVNRLCGSSMDAIATAARAIKCGETNLMIAGGVESMSRAPFVVGKADAAYSRSIKMEDTTIGWRFINPCMKATYGVDSMAETGENIAEEFHISREDQDLFALRSQQRAAEAIRSGRLKQEILAVPIPQKTGEPFLFSEDEHPRPDTTLEAAMKRHGLTPKVRVVAAAAAGVAPRIMGMGPVPATRKVLAKAGLSVGQMDVVELNEAFASQALAVLRELGIPDDAKHVNPNGGAIALGHPLGASGARLVTTALYQLLRTKGRYALCTMCIGVGQGIALILERV